MREGGRESPGPTEQTVSPSLVPTARGGLGTEPSQGPQAGPCDDKTLIITDDPTGLSAGAMLRAWLESPNSVCPPPLPDGGAEPREVRGPPGGHTARKRPGLSPCGSVASLFHFPSPCDDVVPLLSKTLKGREVVVKLAPPPVPTAWGGGGLDSALTPTPGEGDTQEGGQPGTSRENTTFSELLKRWRRSAPALTRRRTRPLKVLREASVGNLAAGPAGFFVCWSQAHRVQTEGFPTSRQRTALPLLSPQAD